MDFFLDASDYLVFDKVYAYVLPNTTEMVSSSNLMNEYQPAFYSLTDDSFNSWLLRDNPIRQFISLYILATVSGLALYFIPALISYWFFFDKAILNHPKFKPNQLRMEIFYASLTIPFVGILAAFNFLLEIWGYSKIYSNFDEYPSYYVPLSAITFFFFTDFGVHFSHRALHHPVVYKYIHKLHHRWVVSTPFASHASHPIDGILQTLPYHLFPFFFPVQKYVYLVFISLANIFVVLAHDGTFFFNNDYIHSTASHAVHHMYFNYNFGQYTNIWDRLLGSYRHADDDLLKYEKGSLTI